MRQLHVLAHAVKKTADYGHVIYLRLLEEQCSSLLPVYIGEWARNAAAALPGLVMPGCMHVEQLKACTRSEYCLCTCRRL